MAELLNSNLFPMVAYLVVPGYIALRIYDLLVASAPRRLGDSVIELIAISLINAALFGRLVTYSEPSALNRYLATILFIFVTPAVIAYATHRIRNAHWARGLLLHPDPTAWDTFFRRRRFCWVICHLKSGKKIGGYYGPLSLASSYPRPQDLYLEEVWRLDENGRFIEAIPQSAGALVRHEQCELLELFTAEGPDDEDFEPFVVYTQEGEKLGKVRRLKSRRRSGG
jgi:Family of unknown function (DUF6338)